MRADAKRLLGFKFFRGEMSHVSFSKFTFSRKNLFIISSCCVGDPFDFPDDGGCFTDVDIRT